MGASTTSTDKKRGLTTLLVILASAAALAAVLGAYLDWVLWPGYSRHDDPGMMHLPIHGR